MRAHPYESAQTTADDGELFTIGRGVGPVGRWLRLFLGVDALALLVLNPLYLHPLGRHALPGFALSVAGYCLLISVVYFGVFALLSNSILAKLNPWAKTGVFLYVLPAYVIPAVLRVLGLHPRTFQVAFGLYTGVGLVLLFFMRYGGCELIALPSLVLKRRFTIYCPINEIDAIERAVTPDRSWTGQGLLTVVSTAIVVFVGGYFIVVKWKEWFGGYGIALDIDNRWSLLLLIPCAQLAGLTLKHLRAQRSFFAPMVRNYALGAVILALAVVITLFPGHGVVNWALSVTLLRWAMALGAIFAVYQVGVYLIRRQHRRPSSGPRAPA